MVTKAFIQALNGERNIGGKITEEVWNDWDKRGMMTSTMQKNLKLVRTYLSKFCCELEENLNKYEQDKLRKQLMKFDYKLLDDYTLQKVFRDMKDKMRYAIIERQLFEPTLEAIAEINCVGCTKDYKECPYHHMFDDLLIPYVKEEPNCPYAVNLQKMSNKEKKHVEEFKKLLRKKNMFYKG